VKEVICSPLFPVLLEELFQLLNLLFGETFPIRQIRDQGTEGAVQDGVQKIADRLFDDFLLRDGGFVETGFSRMRLSR